ncbi:MAG: hypothetical protein ACR2PX_25515 [Endozoicomonas sp.]|uniref:hypothetical protein n=1 Tax=Endozoicomonas sp. TaxID=1892382 RepID=UPI003D9B3265
MKFTFSFCILSTFLSLLFPNFAFAVGLLSINGTDTQLVSCPGENCFQRLDHKNDITRIQIDTKSGTENTEHHYVSSTVSSLELAQHHESAQPLHDLQLHPQSRALIIQFRNTSEFVLLKMDSTPQLSSIEGMACQVVTPDQPQEVWLKCQALDSETLSGTVLYTGSSWSDAKLEPLQSTRLSEEESLAVIVVTAHPEHSRPVSLYEMNRVMINLKEPFSLSKIVWEESPQMIKGLYQDFRPSMASRMIQVNCLFRSCLGCCNCRKGPTHQIKIQRYQTDQEFEDREQPNSALSTPATDRKVNANNPPQNSPRGEQSQ